MGYLHIFDPRKGHTTVTWDPEVEDAVKEAERIFKEKMNEPTPRYAYKVPRGGNGTAERIREFDPQAQEIYVIAPMVGG